MQFSLLAHRWFLRPIPLHGRSHRPLGLYRPPWRFQRQYKIIPLRPGHQSRRSQGPTVRFQRSNHHLRYLCRKFLHLRIDTYDAGSGFYR